jgi:hypothetical protein
MDQFTSNFTICNKKTRQNMDLQLTVYQKGTYYMAIKINNSLPVQMKEKTHDVKQFKKCKKFSLFKYILYSAGIF